MGAANRNELSLFSFLTKWFLYFFTLRRQARDGLVAARCVSSRFQNGSGGGKDVRRVVVGDFSFGFQPVLDEARQNSAPSSPSVRNR
jgi:hypothetical protein